MVSFWPSLGLLLFFLAAFLKCRAIGARVTLPLGGFLPFFAYGAVGATLLSLLLEQVPLFQFPLVENAQLQLVAPAAWLSGPAIEELAKALPIIVLAFVGTTSRRLTIADLTLAGFASGAGFGFVEANLQVVAGSAFPGFTWSSIDFDTVEQFGTDYTICFAGHAVYTGLIALVAAASVRLLPLDRVYTWIPAAFAFVLVFFDHTMFNWKMLHPGLGIGANFIQAPNTLESLYALTFHGRLETWLLPAGLIAAQIAEAWLCSTAIGKRSDLLLPREWRALVINEWFVVLLRLRLGRAAVQRTLVYFRRRRALALTALEAKRNPDDRILTGHVRFLERRLDREREFLVSPPAGAWLLPRSVWLRGLLNYAWRSRWVFAFAILFIVFFMFGPNQLPQFMQAVVRDDTTRDVLVGLAVAFTAWQGYRFWRSGRPDPVSGESTAQALYQARLLVLGASAIGCLFPAILLSWEALVPGGAYITGYFSDWIAQGGNPFALMALAALGGAVDADPEPTGQILRDEMTAAGERIRRLERNFAERAAAVLASLDPSMPQASASGPGGIVGVMGRVLRHDGGGGSAFGMAGTIGGRSSGTPAQATPLDRTLEEFVDLMAKLDADRDAQERRKLLLDELERQAAETRGDDLSIAIQAVQQEFEGLAAELQMVAAKELARMAAFEQAYSKAWAQTMRELDAYDDARRALKEPRQLFWQPQKDQAWAARVAALTDERALPLQMLLLPELESFAAGATGEVAESLNAAMDHIRPQPDAREQPEATEAEAQFAETSEPPAALGLENASDEIAQDTTQPEPVAVESDDAFVLADHGAESEREGTAEETDETSELSEATDAAEQTDTDGAPAQHDDESRAPTIAGILAEVTDERDELERLLDAIKRDSGYLATVKLSDIPAPAVEEKPPEPAVEEPDRAELDALCDEIRRESGYLEAAKDHADPQVEVGGNAEPEATVEPFVAEPADETDTAVEGGEAASSMLSTEMEAPAVDEAPTEPADSVAAEREDLSALEPAEYEPVEAETPVAQEPVELDVEAETPVPQEQEPLFLDVELGEPPEEPREDIAEIDTGSEITTTDSSDADVAALSAISEDPAPESVKEGTSQEAQEIAQHEPHAVEPAPTPTFGFELSGIGKAAMQAAHDMVAKAATRTTHVEELPAADAVELTADSGKSDLQTDLEVPPDTAEQKAKPSFEEHGLIRDAAPSVEPVSAADNSQREATASIEEANRVLVTIQETADVAHNAQAGVEDESKIFETAKRIDVTDFVASQLEYLGDHAPIDEPESFVQEPGHAVAAPEPVVTAPAPVVAPPEPEPVVVAPEPEPVVGAPEPEPIVAVPEPEPVVATPPESTVESAEPVPVSVPDPWNAEAGTLFTLEPVPESDAPIKSEPANLDAHEAASATEQMPLDFTAPAASEATSTAEDIVSSPGETEIPSADPAIIPEPAPEPVATEAAPVEEVHPEPAIITEKPVHATLRAVLDEGKAPKDDSGLLSRVGGYFRGTRKKESQKPTNDLRKVVHVPVEPTPIPTEIAAPVEAQQYENIVSQAETAAPLAVTDALAPAEPEAVVATATALPEQAPEPATPEEQSPPSEGVQEQTLVAAADPTLVAAADPATSEPPTPEQSDAKNTARDAALGNLVEQLLAHLQKAGAPVPAPAQQGNEANSLPELVEQLRAQVQKLGDRPQDQGAGASEPSADPQKVREDTLSNLVEQLRAQVQKAREPSVETASPQGRQTSEPKVPLGEISLPKLEDFLRAHLDTTETQPTAPLPKPHAPPKPAIAAPVREQKPAEHAAPAGKPARSARAANRLRSKPANEKKAPASESAPKPERHLHAEKPAASPTVAPASESAPKPERHQHAEKPAASPTVASASGSTAGPEKFASLEKVITPPPATSSTAKPGTNFVLGEATPPAAPSPAKPGTNFVLGKATPPSAAEKQVRLVRDIGPRGVTKVEPDKKGPSREAEASNTGGTRPSKFFNPGQVRPDVEDVTAQRKMPVERRGSESRLSEAVAAYYDKKKLPLPPMHTTDAANLRKIIDSGKLETPRRGPAPWSFSGVLRKGDVAVRLKPGAEKYIEFVPSNETFGQVTRFYPRSVGVGAFKTFIPAEHLEYFDLTSHEWRALKQ